MKAYQWLRREWDISSKDEKWSVGIITVLGVLIWTKDTIWRTSGGIEAAIMVLFGILFFGLKVIIPFAIASSARKRGRRFQAWFWAATLVPGVFFTGIAYLIFGHKNPPSSPSPEPLSPEEEVRAKRKLENFLGVTSSVQKEE